MPGAMPDPMPQGMPIGNAERNRKGIGKEIEDKKPAPESLKLLGKIFTVIFKKPTPNLIEHNRILKGFEDQSAANALQWWIDNPDNRQFFNLANAGSFESTICRLIEKANNPSRDSDDNSETIVVGMPNGATL